MEHLNEYCTLGVWYNFNTVSTAPSKMLFLNLFVSALMAHSLPVHNKEQQTQMKSELTVDFHYYHTDLDSAVTFQAF